MNQIEKEVELTVEESKICSMIVYINSSPAAHT